MERDGKKRGKQLVNVADHLCISQGIKSLLSLHCASRLHFFGADSHAFLKKRNCAACRIYRNQINSANESWDLKLHK